MIPLVAVAQAGGRKLIWPQRFPSGPGKKKEERGEKTLFVHTELTWAQLMTDGKLQSSTPEIHLDKIVAA